MLLDQIIVLIVGISNVATARVAQQVLLNPSSTSEPNWFQTRPQSFQGPTATGAAPFLAQTNPAPFGHTTYRANYPLETSEPIHGAGQRNAFHHLGNLSPYYPGEKDWGVDEYPRPDGSDITQMHLLHRHGSRYPTGGEHLEKWGKKIMNAAAENAVFTGKLAFLNHWVYGLGENILVTRGRQELFASGILNFFNYGALYNNQSKLVVRTTTKDRILKSAENFVSGFFGLDWRDNANILAAIEAKGFNTSLMSTNACPNSARSFGKYASAPRDQWKEKYLRHRTKKLRELSGEYDWTVSDSYNAQAVCAYETVSLGYSPFCPLFNYEEWEGFSYASDIWFSAASGFQSPTGRAQGITWVEEFIARVEDRPFNVSGGPTAANLTLNANPVTFPHNQSLYLDFTHDTILVSVLTALGFKQFASFLPASGPPRHHQFRTNRVVPFASRINIEIIRSPHEIRHRRSRHRHADPYIPGTGETHYVHFLLNQRTLPMYSSFKQCGRRDDGWCELSTFLDIQKKSLERAQFEYSCTGDWEIGEYGSVHDGVPAKLL